MGHREKEQLTNIFEHDALIGLIYDAVLEPLLWPELLAKMGHYLKMMPSQSGALNKQFESSYHSLALHFKRAAKISDRVSGLQSVLEAFTEVVNRLPVGVILVRRDASVLVLNTAASGLLESSNVLSVRDARLLANSQKNTVQLHAMIQGQLSNQNLESIPMHFSRDDVSSVLWVTTGSSVAHSNVHIGEAVAVVFIYSPSMQKEIPLSAFADKYALSQAEARLTKTMLNGCHTLNDAAECLSVSKHTVRAQMKSVFAKTGVNSQIELMKKIFTSSCMLLATPVMNAEHANIQADQVRCGDMLCMYLKDGRRLSWYEYGALDGKPVMVFESLTGAGPDYSIAKDLGIRLIVPNRPGMKGSDSLHGRGFTDWAEDVRELADYLGMERFSLIGYSAGTPYVLACAGFMPERIRHISLVACMAPVRSVEDLNGMLPLNHTIMKYGHSSPELLREFMTVFLNDLERDSSSYFECVAEHQPMTDINVLKDHEIKQHLLQAFQEAAKDNFHKLCDEIVLCASNWSLDVGCYKGSTSIWHGEDDPLVPIAMGKRVAEHFLNLNEHYLEDEGNYLIYTHWEKVLSDCVCR